MWDLVIHIWTIYMRCSVLSSACLTCRPIIIVAMSVSNRIFWDSILLPTFCCLRDFLNATLSSFSKLFYSTVPVYNLPARGNSSAMAKWTPPPLSPTQRPPRQSPPRQRPLDRDPLDTNASGQRPPWTDTPPGQRPPGHRRPWTETPSDKDPPHRPPPKQAVRILLECILVYLWE